MKPWICMTNSPVNISHYPKNYLPKHTIEEVEFISFIIWTKLIINFFLQQYFFGNYSYWIHFYFFYAFLVIYFYIKNLPILYFSIFLFNLNIVNMSPINWITRTLNHLLTYALTNKLTRLCGHIFHCSHMLTHAHAYNYTHTRSHSLTLTLTFTGPTPLLFLQNHNREVWMYIIIFHELLSK